MSREQLFIFYLVPPFIAPFTCNLRCVAASLHLHVVIIILGCRATYVTLQSLIRCLLQEEMKAQLKAGLASLPAPSNDFEIVLPEVSCRSLYTA